MRHRSTPVLESALLDSLRRQAKLLGLKIVPVLFYCERVAVPTVIGIIKPAILLPLTLTSGLAPEQIEAILAHELAHLRRYDQLVNLLQRLVESTLFFHPAIWWLSRRIRIERELCCDDLVIKCGSVPLEYAQSLLYVAELSRKSTVHPAVSAVSLLATGQPSMLRQRIARLLGDTTQSHIHVQHRWPALALSAMCLIVAWSTTRVGWSVASDGIPQKSTKSEPQSPENALLQSKPLTFVTSEELPQGAQQQFGTSRFRVPGWFRKTVAFSADGQQIYVNADEHMTVLDRESGRAIAAPRVDPGKGHVLKMAVSEDRKLIVFGMCNPTISDVDRNCRLLVIDTETGQRKTLRWKEMRGEFPALSVSLDKKFLVAGNQTDGIKLWNLETGAEIAKPSWSELSVQSAAFSPDGETLVVLGGKKSLIWNWKTDEPPRELARQRNDRPLTVKYSPDGRWFVVGYHQVDGVRVFDAKTGDMAWQIETRGKRLYPDGGVAFTGDSRMVAVPLTWGNAIELWDLETRKKVHSFDCHEPRTVAITEDGKWIAGGGSDNQLHLWDLVTHQRESRNPESHSGPIFELKISPDFQSLASASDDGTVRIWNVATGKLSRKLDHESGCMVKGLAISPNGQLVVSSALDNTIGVWERSTGKRLLTLAGHGQLGGFRPVQFIPDGSRFATWGDDLRLCWWNSQNGKLLSAHEIKLPGLPSSDERFDGDGELPEGVFSADAETLLLVYDGKLYEFDAATGRQRRQVPTSDRAWMWQVSPDNKWFATCESVLQDAVESSPREATLKLWNRNSLEVIHRIKCERFIGMVLTFSPDSSHLAFTDTLGSISVANVQTGQILARIPIRSECEALRFSPDGKSLASAHRDATMVMWDWQKFTTKTQVGATESKPADQVATVAEKPIQRSSIQDRQRVAVETSEKHGLQITGRVVNEQKQPVPNATVCLPIVDSGDEKGQRGCLTQTDGDGKFQLEVEYGDSYVTRRQFLLWVHAEGYQLGYVNQPGKPWSPDKQTIENVTIVMAGTSDVALQILAGDAVHAEAGTPEVETLVMPEVYAVEVGKGDQASVIAYYRIPQALRMLAGVKTDSKGLVKLPAASSTRLSRVQIESIKRGTQSLALVGERSFKRPIILQPEPVGRLEGRVTSTDNAKVEGLRFLINLRPTDELLGNYSPLVQAITTDREGRFGVPLTPGTVDVRTDIQPGATHFLRHPKQISIGIRETVALEMQLEKPATVVGQVVHKNGQPMTNMPLIINSRAGSGYDIVHTDQHGRFTGKVLAGEMLLHPRAGWCVDRATIMKFVVPQQPQPFPIPPLQIEDVRGRLLDQTGRPVVITEPKPPQTKLTSPRSLSPVQAALSTVPTPKRYVLALHLGLDRNPDGSAKSTIPVMFHRGEVIPLSQYLPHLKQVRTEIEATFGDGAAQVLEESTIHLHKDQDERSNALSKLIEIWREVGFDRFTFAD
ncbi:MAG: M56 family metallopeptidase [Planctomycetota bacterium]